MKKQLISLCLSLSIIGAGLIPQVPVLAAGPTSSPATNSSQTDTSKKNLKLPTTPAFFEHQTANTDLGKSGLDDLVTVAERAQSNNSAANKVNLAATILTYINGGTATYWCRVLTGVSNALQSDLDAFGTVDFCYRTSRYLDNNPGYSSVNANIPEQRFWNGDRYTSDWYPIDSPSAVYYH